MNRRIWIFLGLVAAAVVTWAGVGNKAAIFDGIVETTAGGYMFPDGTLQTTGIVVAAASKTYEFVGTTTAVSPGSGVLGLTSHCQSEFGADARMCNSEEIMDTVTIPPPSAWQTSEAWVRPIFVEVALRATTTPARPWMIDASGVMGEIYDMNCEAWSASTSYQGLTVGMPETGRQGLFSPVDCTSPAGVACCAPPGT